MALGKKNKSALKEVAGVEQPATTNRKAVRKIQLKKKKVAPVATFVSKILEGNIPFLSQAITLIESTNPKHQDKANSIIEQCLKHQKKTIRIGITGVPGVGKSTFIESYGKDLTAKGHKVAILAVDPSSSIHQGSILGDKTRMQELVKDPNAYIRPSPSGSSLGGVARKTKEAIILCEAAGFDYILIETVGVGQSETAVYHMVDFFLLLKLAGAGDELQGIKRGIIEMSDAIIINKADGDNIPKTKMAKIEFQKALHLYPIKESKWGPKVLTCSSTEQKGIREVYEMIDQYLTLTKENGYFKKQRILQNQYWLKETIQNTLIANFYRSNTTINTLNSYIERINAQEITPFMAAQQLLKGYKDED